MQFQSNDGRKFKSNICGLVWLDYEIQWMDEFLSRQLHPVVGWLVTLLLSMPEEGSINIGYGIL